MSKILKELQRLEKVEKCSKTVKRNFLNGNTAFIKSLKKPLAKGFYSITHYTIQQDPLLVKFPTNVSWQIFGKISNRF